MPLKYEVFFCILALDRLQPVKSSEPGRSSTGRVTVICKPGENPRDVFERECQNFAHTNWRYLSSEPIEVKANVD